MADIIDFAEKKKQRFADKANNVRDFKNARVLRQKEIKDTCIKDGKIDFLAMINRNKNIPDNVVNLWEKKDE